jgi:dienelactone hydrolase
MDHCRRLIPACAAVALALAFPGLATADKLDLDRITPVPANEPIPVMDFFRPPLLRDPRLNPAGTHVAAIIAAGEDHTSLMVYELKTKKLETVGVRGDSDVDWVSWLNADRLVYGVSVKKLGSFALCAGVVGVLNESFPLLQNVGATLVAVPPNDRTHPLLRLPPKTSNTGRYGEVVTANAKLRRGSLMDTSGGGSLLDQSHIDEARDENDAHIVARHPILETPEGFDLYYLADKEGKLAFGVTSTAGVLALHRLVDKRWEKCPEDLDEIKVIDSGEKPGEIVVLGARREGKTRLLEFLNAADATPGEVLLEDPAYDFNGWLYRDPVSHNIAGVIYDRIKPKVVWFPQAYRDLQKAVDGLFPGTDTVVRILGNDEEDKGMVMIGTYSDRQPMSFHWVDLKNHSAGPIQNSMPWIDPKRMQPMGAMKFKTRDGRTLDAYVTLPVGASKQNPAPLVVLPHDGTDGRDTWGFNSAVQFFANRGYAVLQPNHRGSSGYTWMFPTEDEYDFRKMHDDVTEATKALIASGYIDRNRVAIVGTSFGGFLALSGAAYEPTLYRCAVAVSPVSDWGKSIQENKYNQFSDASYARMVRKLGDPKKDPEKFDAIAPLRHAEQIRAAVLIAYGEYDPSYEISEAKELVSIVRKNRLPAETMSFVNEGYGVRHLGHKVELYSRIEAFLAENLGPAGRIPIPTSAAP